MHESEKPAYLRLSMRSCDDHVGAVFTWRGMVGGQEPLLVVTTLAYDERLAKLPKLARISLLVSGRERHFALLSCEPTDQAQAPTLAKQPGHVPADADESLLGPGWSVTMDFEASEQTARDFNRLVERIGLSSNTQQVALGSAGRLTEN